MTDHRQRPAFRLDAVMRRVPAVRLYVSSTGTLALGVAAQFFAFAILARWLGATQFGQLMTITSITNLVAPLCGIGASEAMIRRVAREPALYPVALGHSLILMLISGALLTLIAISGLSLFVQAAMNSIANLTTLAIFAFSNIILFRWVMLVESIFLARREFMRANIVNSGFLLGRSLAAVVACVGFGVDRLEVWALWYGAVHVLGAAACSAAIWRYGAPRWRLLREEVRLGVHYTTPFFFDSLRQNVDLLALGGIATPAAIGQYSAASRIMLTSRITVNSFNRLLYPKLAAVGRGGVAATLRLSLKYVALAVGLAAATSGCLFAVAPYMAWAFGKDFGDMTLYLQILSWIVILLTLQDAAYNVLGAADQHAIRSVVYNVGTAASALLIVVLTRLFGLPGTFIAVFISHALVGIALWVTAVALSRRPTGPISPPIGNHAVEVDG